MSNDAQTQNRKPSFIAFAVRDGEDNKSYFNRIGAVWPHKDGEGYDVVLEALPVNGRVVLRTFQERAEAGKDDARGGRDDRRDEKRSSSREDRREAGLRYER
jgi:hypothetical protein